MRKTNQEILEMLKKFIGPKSINKYDVDIQQGLILARSQEEQTCMKEIEQKCFKHIQSKKVIYIYIYIIVQILWNHILKDLLSM